MRSLLFGNIGYYGERKWRYKIPMLGVFLVVACNVLLLTPLLKRKKEGIWIITMTKLAKHQALAVIAPALV